MKGLIYVLFPTTAEVCPMDVHVGIVKKSERLDTVTATVLESKMQNIVWHCRSAWMSRIY